MLRNIPACISPDLMHALMTMGHGDEVVFADADFPAATYSKRVIRADGVDVETLLNAVLPFFPLDSFVDNPAITMDCSEWGDEPESYRRFRTVIRQFYRKFTDFKHEKRYDFYKRTANAFVVVVTSEADGNVILKKGPVMAELPIHEPALPVHGKRKIDSIPTIDSKASKKLLPQDQYREKK